MADDAKDASSETPAEGVFGNLPSTRPGSRSPRRTSGATAKGEAPKKKAKASAAKPAARKPPAKPKPEPPKPSRPESPPPQLPAEAQAPGNRVPGVEDLAWTGITVAAQAATAGIRFASKALEAARKSIERP